MFRVARKIRVGRETGNTHIYFFLALPKYAPSILPLLIIPCTGQVLFALRFISENFFIKGYEVWLPTSVNFISIQCMVN